MRHRLAARSGIYLATFLIAFAPLVTAGAATLVQNLAATSGATLVPGQSVTTPSGGPFNNISFNFFDRSGNPVASGTLFLLSQQYTSTPGNLNSSSTGFIAQSTGISGGIYQFDPSVTLQSNTQYFFYGNQSFLFADNGTGNPYAGGVLYDTITPGDLFATSALSDADFRLSGQSFAPLPSALALGTSCLPLGLLALALRRRG